MYASSKIPIDATVDVIIAIWNNASIPTIQKQSIFKKLKTLINDCNNVSAITQRNALKDKMNVLFDIATCKCQVLRLSNQCHCSRNKKIPEIEREFLFDQRHDRKMTVSSALDIKRTQSLQRQSFRTLQFMEVDDFVSSPVLENISSSDTDHISSYESDDPNFEITSTSSDSTTTHIPNLPNVALSADRFNVSDRATASICSAFLVDLGMVTSDNKSMVIDRHKIRRERELIRNKIKADINIELSKNEIVAIYFDGRKDLTISKEKIDNKYRFKSTREEHITIITEPDGNYLTHVVPESGNAIDISKSIVSVIDEFDCNSTMQFIGCDSTNVNTGPTGGAIHYVEEYLQRPLHWCVCMLHTNERPLRHIFTKIDGPTTGSDSFFGPIGKQLKFNNNPPVANFICISDGDGIHELSEAVLNDMSCDQVYLYSIVNAIRSGNISADLANTKIGPINHSRWITLASRICRLYVSCEKPNKNLYDFTQFIVTNYAPLWFSIKCKPKFRHGPEHILLAIKLYKLLPINIQNIIKPIMNKNTYFAHSENLLLSMLCNDDDLIRNAAVNRIQKVRSDDNDSLRIFHSPSINFDAHTIEQLIDWETVDVFEPPFTMKFDNAALEGIKNNKLILPFYPIHTQNVERCVKTVTEASTTVYGFEARDGFIKAKICHHKIMPSFESKKYFAFI